MQQSLEITHILLKCSNYQSNILKLWIRAQTSEILLFRDVDWNPSNLFILNAWDMRGPRNHQWEGPCEQQNLGLDCQKVPSPLVKGLLELVLESPLVFDIL